MATASNAVGQVVTPGDAVLQLPEEGAVRIGSGLRVTDTHVVAQKCGVVRQTRKGQLWLEGRQKRYLPAEGDAVIGTIVDKSGREQVRVDIGGPFPAQLSLLAFEGVTRRNLPRVAAGDVIYARLTTTDKDLDPVLSCVDAQGRSAGFGHLQGGLLLTVTCSYARALLQVSPVHPLLQALGAALQFEIVVGMNGRVWVNAADPRSVIKVATVLQKGEFVDELTAGQYVRDLLLQLDTSMSAE